MGLHATGPRTVIIPLLAVGALVVAGCGSSNPSGSTVAHIGSTTTATTTADTGGPLGGGLASHYQQLVRFAECMRAHGEPDFPDPVQSGNGVQLRLNNNVDPRSPQFQAAQKACASYAPPGIAAGGSPAKLREELDAFAACMRSHGEPNFPDPKVSSSSAPGGRNKVAVQIGGPGINPRSPQYAKAQQACRSFLQGSS
jgi:hypothetical protein